MGIQEIIVFAVVLLALVIFIARLRGKTSKSGGCSGSCGGCHSEQPCSCKDSEK